MPFHYGHREHRIVSQSSPTGTQYLQAVGTALGARRDGLDEVVYVSSGEGATSEGEFHEALNWAAREKLPVIFLIQDNKYAISVPEERADGGRFRLRDGQRIPGAPPLRDRRVRLRARATGRAADAVARARRGEGPSLIDAHTVRLLPHSSSDDQRKYRSPEELAEDLERDPIPRLEAYLVANRVLTTDRSRS